MQCRIIHARIKSSELLLLSIYEHLTQYTVKSNRKNKHFHYTQ